MMKPISLNDYLNKDNSWTNRLLGIVPFKKNRDLTQVENEYNLDKYAALLKFEFDTVEEYKVKEFELGGLNAQSTTTISYVDNLFEIPLSLARNLFYNIIKTKLSQYPSEYLCELGCGYGYNLSYLGQQTYGGEYSKNAVKLAQKLNREVVEFNYYEEKDYHFIKRNSTIFTSHSIEQIPDATSVIKNLKQQRGKINFVIHFEPTLVEGRNNLFGVLRNKYIEINDYNRNLIKLLKADEEIEIIELEYDAFGLNPLNSSNIIVWRFKK